MMVQYAVSMLIWRYMWTLTPLGVAVTSQRELARSEHVSKSDLPDTLSEKVQLALPPVCTSAPYEADMPVIFHVTGAAGAGHSAAGESATGVELDKNAREASGSSTSCEIGRRIVAGSVAAAKSVLVSRN